MNMIQEVPPIILISLEAGLDFSIRFVRLPDFRFDHFDEIFDYREVRALGWKTLQAGDVVVLVAPQLCLRDWEGHCIRKFALH